MTAKMSVPLKPNANKDGTSSPPTNASALSSLLSSYLSLIQQYLNMPSCVDNAIFLAEQCVAQAGTAVVSGKDDSEEEKEARKNLTLLQNDAVYWLAMCYYRSGQVQRAQQTLLSLLQQHQEPSPESSLSAAMYLLAVCCSELEDYAQAETVLLRSCRQGYQRYQQEHQQQQPPAAQLLSMEDWIVTTTPCPIPNGAVGLGLLGKLCSLQQCHSRAKKYFKMSLQLDPFLWTSVKALCDLGCDVSELDIPNILGTGNMTTARLDQQPGKEDTASESMMTMDTPIAPSQPLGTLQTPGLTPILPRQPLGAAPPPAAPGKAQNAKPETSASWTNTTPASSSSRDLRRFHISNDGGEVLSRAKDVVNRQYYPPPSPVSSPAESISSMATPVTRVTQSMHYLRGLGRKPPLEPLSAHPDSKSNTSTPFQRTTLSNVGASAANQKVRETPAVNATLSTATQSDAMNVDDTAKEKTAGKDNAAGLDGDSSSDGSVQDILLLLSHLGVAYQHLTQYRCRDALSVLSTLPSSSGQRTRPTAWVLQMKGRAYLDMNDFENAERCLLAMRKLDPGCMEGIELLSTVYWQLKREVELAHLAQRVVDYDRLSPQAWCVVGNCFSLQKDHETALVFFGRSLQLEPNFTYAHTLSGYEYMANEDFDAAIACFRQALKTDQRHYNAWYGLGAIYHRQEKYDLAEYHLQRASSLHPTSSVLLCNLGMAQYANGKAYEALATLSRAFELDPRNPQARFQRATIYVALHRPQQALAELEQVRDAAPREATVHFSMGKVYKKLGQPEMAMKCFLTAMDLDPKDNNLQLIKSAMDKLDEPDVDDEEEVAAF